MARSLKSLQTRPDAAALRQLATADPTIPPAVMPSRNGRRADAGEMLNLRVASSLIDQLDAAADAERTTRKVIVTRALAAAGYRVRAMGSGGQDCKATAA